MDTKPLMVVSREFDRDRLRYSRDEVVQAQINLLTALTKEAVLAANELGLKGKKVVKAELIGHLQTGSHSPFVTTELYTCELYGYEYVEELRQKVKELTEEQIKVLDQIKELEG